MRPIHNIKIFLIVFLTVVIVGGGAMVLVSTLGGQTLNSEGGQTPNANGGQTTNSEGGQTPNEREFDIDEKLRLETHGGQTPDSNGGQTLTQGGQTPESNESSAAPRARYEEFLSDPERMDALNIHEVITKNPDEFVMDFAGDILFDSSYAVMSQIRQRGGHAEHGFSRAVMNELKNADITILNNEFPYSDRGAPLPDKTYTFRAKPEYANLLDELGVDAVSLANNHAFDYGEDALLDTMDTLTDAGIFYIGAGRDIKEASREISYIAGDTKIAVIAATQIERIEPPDTRPAKEGVPGVFRCWNVKPLLERVRELDKENDVVIVFIHWGTESTTELDWAQLEQAKQITEAGADIIVGDHPHVLQAFEYVNGVPVAYSLGNFLFNSKTLDTCVLQLVIPIGSNYPPGETYDSSKIKVRVIPAKQQDCRVDLLQDEEKKRVLSYLNGLSSTGVLDDEGYLSPVRR